MNMRFALLIGLITIMCSACTEKETIYVTDHENVNVDGNVSPPYDEVTSVQIQNYINKLYIDFLGREPSIIELDNATLFLKNNSLSATSRTQLIDDLLADDAYYTSIWEVYRRAYLNGVSDQDMEVQILIYTNAYNDAIQNPDPLSQAFAALLLMEIEKMEALVDARDDYANGMITIDQFMGRIAYNSIYDEINMGSENMVLSCFENFLKRLPTNAELQAGVAMVDGQGAQLLLQDGNDKQEFVEIITSTPEFYEGLAFDVYQQLLVREPTSEEMAEFTEEMIANKDFEAVQLKVAISDEYAGF